MTVMPLEDSTVGLQVFVTGIEASMNIGTTFFTTKYLKLQFSAQAMARNLWVNSS